jgi:ATP-dependent DNA helicase RecG
VADIEDALRFVERNTRTAYRIERLKRENVPEYPMKALREAITNAVMHRDWFIEGANVFVEIYGDRIEVVSPGGLPRGMTLADLGRKSVRRNTLIADLLHRVGFIEKAGTGIKRIRDEVREQGCPEPEFEANGFVTAIFRPNPQVRAEAESGVQSGDHPLGQREHQDGTKLAPSRHQVAILLKCKADQSLTALMAITGRSDRTKFRGRVIKPLVAMGLLEMTIPDKPRSSKQRYRLTRAGTEYLKRTNERE